MGMRRGQGVRQSYDGKIFTYVRTREEKRRRLQELYSP
jgi:hypothetical protein